MRQRRSTHVATKDKPMELFVFEKYMPTDTRDSLEDRMMVAAFRCLQEGFGFGLGTHHITPCEYAEVLTYLQTVSHDVDSELSTSSSPMCLEEAYLGKQSAGRLA